MQIYALSTAEPYAGFTLDYAGSNQFMKNYAWSRQSLLNIYMVDLHKVYAGLRKNEQV